MNITPNLAPAPWSVRHFQPAAPVGKKWCAVCRKPMNARDKHARCQSCRNGGGYLAVKYRAICGACRKPFIRGKPQQKGCSLSCGQLIRRAEARAKREKANDRDPLSAGRAGAGAHALARLGLVQGPQPSQRQPRRGRGGRRARPHGSHDAQRAQGGSRDGPIHHPHEDDPR